MAAIWRSCDFVLQGNGDKCDEGLGKVEVGAELGSSDGVSEQVWLQGRARDQYTQP